MLTRLPLLLTRACMTHSRGVSTSSRRLDELPLTFASPYQSFYENRNIRQVDVSTLSGDMGILPNHVPVIAALKPGLVSVYEQEGDTKSYFVSSGVITVNEDSSVQILAEEAAPLSHLDRAEALKGLERCQQELSRAASEEERVRASIGVEFHEAALKEI